MVILRNVYSDSIQPRQAKILIPSRDKTEFDEYGAKSNSVYKIFWDFGLRCFTPRHRSPISTGDDDEEDANRGGNGLEHNKAWLLAESGGCDADEPHSVHSSFQFSLYSQVELESIAMNRGSSSAAVLMVNLENGFLTDSHSAEVKLRRFESLVRSISPVAHSLIRFSYSEILAATRNFSEGRVLGRGALSCVFKGRVGFRKTAVAIKWLDKEDKDSSKAFCRELMIASSLHNPHIVPLVGFCIDTEQGLF